MNIKRTWFDNLIEVICVLLVVGTIGYLLVNWNTISEQIPMHYNFKGEIDRMGSKGELWVLPILNLLIYIGITVTEAFPKIWNVGVTVTEENKERVYRLVKTMIGTTKLIVVITFTYLEVHSIRGGNLPWYFLLLFLGVLFGEIIFFMVRLYKIK